MTPAIEIVTPAKAGVQGSLIVAPAQAGVQGLALLLDSGFRRNDGMTE